MKNQSQYVVSRRPTLFISLLVAMAMILAACQSSATPTNTQVPAAPAPTATTATAATETPATVVEPTIMVASNPTLGQILVDGKGMTLYMFTKDTANVSNCSGGCLVKWPPLLTNGQPKAGDGVDAAMLGSTTLADGRMIVTYNNMPLYYWAGDTKPGDISGENVLGTWFAVSPGGKSVMPPAESTATVAPTAVAPTTAPTATVAPTAVITTTAPTATSQPAANVSGKIALLLPETKTTRYETADRPDFEAKMKELCPNCQIIYSNANQDANAQLSQAEAALTNGAQVLVLDPVDSSAAGAIADKAKAQGVPVIAYDRLILNSSGVNYYISFDNVQVGKLQAQSLIDKLNAEGIQNPTIVMINGSPTDNNASLFKQGAHSVFDPLVKAGKLTIAKEYDTPDWSPDQAQTEMQQALTALGNKVDGVYCANDGTASGAIAAMKAAGLSPLPPVTGQDAELAGIQRILAGEQYMTIYKAIKPEAEAAAQLAFDLLTQTPVPSSMTNGQTTNNGTIDVPSVLLTPIAVTKANIETTVVADGFWTADQICTADYASACAATGVH